MVAPIAFQSLEDVFAKAAAKNEDPFILLLDELQDPQNVGALIRTADAAGADASVIAVAAFCRIQKQKQVHPTCNTVTAGRCRSGVFS